MGFGPGPDGPDCFSFKGGEGRGTIEGRLPEAHSISNRESFQGKREVKFTDIMNASCARACPAPTLKIQEDGVAPWGHAPVSDVEVSVNEASAMELGQCNAQLPKHVLVADAGVSEGRKQRLSGDEIHHYPGSPVLKLCGGLGAGNVAVRVMGFFEHSPLAPRGLMSEQCGQPSGSLGCAEFLDEQFSTGLIIELDETTIETLANHATWHFLFHRIFNRAMEGQVTAVPSAYGRHGRIRP